MSQAPVTTLVVTIDDEVVRIDVDLPAGGDAGIGPWDAPVGPTRLHADHLADKNPPGPVALTNALGVVEDHIDDILVMHPEVAAVEHIVLRGRHALTLARVEVGVDDVALPCTITRADADEVFRTIATERRSDRLANPGLPADEVDSVVGACCIALAIVRKLDHDAFVVDTDR